MYKEKIRYLYRKYKFKGKVRRTILLNKYFRSNLDCIILDLTSYCDFYCVDCNRSCGKFQAQSNDIITLNQIKKFIRESISSKKKWKRIQLEGGEPTLHPDIDTILDLLLKYKKDHSTDCEIRLCTNGNGVKSKSLQKNPPDGLKIYSSDKFINSNNGHFSFNVAPIDITEYKNEDFTKACYIHKLFGLGLTKTGYYPHSICGGIDRIFGFNIGLKKLPKSSLELEFQMKKLCRYCGHFIQYSYKRGKIIRKTRLKENKFEHGMQSASWKSAYSEYKKRKPDLTLY